MRECWSKTVGGHGYTVTVTERRPGGTLSLTWWSPADRRPIWQTLRHRDRARAEKEALRVAGLLQQAREAEARGLITVSAFLERFRKEVVRHRTGEQPKEDARRIDLWVSVLGPASDINAIDPETLDRFVRERRAGEILVPNRALKGTVTDRTVGADLEFLRRALNWGRRVKGQDGKRLITETPFEGFSVPSTANPKRPMATYDRWRQVRAVADAVDGQRLFGGFMDLLDWLGWRVTALCSLSVTDLDLTASADGPTGRIKKQGAFDKERVEMWVPIPQALRLALRRLLKVRATLPDSPHLFPGARDATKPWTRFHARQLLRRCETRAGLERIVGGQFHPYRRAWVTARKAEPLKDIAEAGGWKGTRALELYMQADAQTMLKVVSSTKRVGGSRQGPTPKLSKPRRKAVRTAKG